MSMIETSFRQPPVSLNLEPLNTPAMQAAMESTLDADGMSVAQLEKFLLDIRDEPEWRAMANRCADYYDHNQLPDDVLAELRRRGLPPLVINLTHPTINTVLGMEAKTRTDWKVNWEDEQYEEVATAIGKKLTEAERETGADRAISNAYAGQIKAGLHWVEVGFNNRNPLAPCPYRVDDVHRREIWWDWRKKNPEEWRWLVRRQRFDADALLLAFPQAKDMITSAIEGGLAWQEYAIRLDSVTGMGQFVDLERALTIEGQEWIDTFRKQISVFEVWYRKYVRGFVARVNGVPVEVDRSNPRHMLAIASGVMKPVLCTYPKLRQAIFIGPHRVIDRATPLPHRKIPYIPFFGYREDLTGAPYGLIRGMLSPQDEINARRSKLLALLNSRRVQADADALDTKANTHEDAADEVSRHNSYIVLNPNRRNKDGFQVSDNSDLSAGQATILEQSKQEIHQTSGVFPPMAGDQSGGLSGLAINSLVEQGTQTLAEINDNYTWARREVGELLLDHVKADSLHEHDVTVGEDESARTITLNARKNENGVWSVENQVASARLKLVLDDVPSTPAWRQQQSAHLAEITKSLPPQLQAFVVPFYIEGTDLRDRKKIARLLRKQLGIPEDGPNGEQQVDPQVQQLQEQLAQMQQEAEARIQQATEAAQKAMAENERLKLEAANRERELAVRDKEVTTKGEADLLRAQAEKARIEHEIATFQPAPAVEPADPQAIVRAVVEAVTPVLEENGAAVRELAGEVDAKISELAKTAKEDAARDKAEEKPAPAPAQPPAINVYAGTPPPPEPEEEDDEPQEFEIELQTPFGPIKGIRRPVAKKGNKKKPGGKKAAGEMDSDTDSAPEGPGPDETPRHERAEGERPGQPEKE